MSRYSHDPILGDELISGNTYYNMIASVETSPTTSAHSKGDHFIYNGVLYEVTATNGINANTTLVVYPATGYNIKVADKIENQIDSVKQALTKNAIVLGDSYASGTGSPDGYGIFHFLEPYFDNAYLFSGSGTGFTDYNGQHTNDTFSTHLTDAINSSLFSNSDITDIVILAAYGDSRQYIQSGRRAHLFANDIASAVASFATLARSNFANLKRIIYVDCESREENAIVSGGYTSYFSDSINANKYIERNLNMAGIINLGSVGGYVAFKSDYFSSDKYHCNTYGYEYLANAIIRLLEKNKNTVFLQTVNNISIDISSVTGITGSTITGKCYLENNIPKLRLLFANIKAGTFTPVASYTKLPITNADYMGVIDEVGRIVTVVALPVDGTIYNLNIHTYADSTGQGIEVKFNESTSKSVASDVVCAVSVEF